MMRFRIDLIKIRSLTCSPLLICCCVGASEGYDFNQMYEATRNVSTTGQVVVE